MTVMTGTVVDGQIVVPEAGLVEGATVTILVPDGDETGFLLGPAEESRLLESMREADAGELIDGDELLRTLDAR